MEHGRGSYFEAGKEGPDGSLEIGSSIDRSGQTSLDHWMWDWV